MFGPTSNTAQFFRPDEFDMGDEKKVRRIDMSSSVVSGVGRNAISKILGAADAVIEIDVRSRVIAAGGGVRAA